MTIRERFLLVIIAGLLVGLWMRDRAEAQGPAMLFGRDSVSGATSVIQTNGTNALKVVGQ